MCDLTSLRLVLPDASHEAEFGRVMDRWEALEARIQPELLRRDDSRTGANVPYAKWLGWSDAVRVDRSMLSTGVTCSLYFLMHREREIMGGMVINHAPTHRGHLHAGIAPWHRGKGLGTAMLSLARVRCAAMGMDRLQIVPRKDNVGAIATILRNGGRLLEEFCEDETWYVRYEVDTLTDAGMEAQAARPSR